MKASSPPLIPKDCIYEMFVRRGEGYEQSTQARKMYEAALKTNLTEDEKVVGLRPIIDLLGDDVESQSSDDHDTTAETE